MNKREFSQIRNYFGKTQSQLAELLSVSPKAIQSFEQGWRNIPAYVERQMLFLLSLKRASSGDEKPCWEICDCPSKWRNQCSAWEFKAGQFCWFVNGTYCQGNVQGSWQKKMELCRQCEAFRLWLAGQLTA
jgi:DNA-binding XRE family transcriptional regulator